MKLCILIRLKLLLMDILLQIYYILSEFPFNYIKLRLYFKNRLIYMVNYTLKLWLQ